MVSSGPLAGAESANASSGISDSRLSWLGVLYELGDFSGCVFMVPAICWMFIYYLSQLMNGLSFEMNPH